MPTWYPDTSTSKPASRYPQGIPYTRGDGSSSLQSTSSPSGSGYGTHLPADSTISAAAAGAPYESATQPGSRKDNYVARRTPWLPFTVDPELGEGSMTYHKIGDAVRIRRYFSSEQRYSSWMPGRVERPVLTTSRDNATSRKYSVSYIDAYTGQVKVKDFDPVLYEVAPIPALHVREASKPHSKDTKPYTGDQHLVFALVGSRPSPNMPPRPVWTPAVILRVSQHMGVQVRLLSGPSRGQHVYGVNRLIPYTPQYAAEFKRQGHVVDGDGVQNFQL